jgi:hypothetical protein
MHDPPLYIAGVEVEVGTSGSVDRCDATDATGVKLSDRHRDPYVAGGRVAVGAPEFVEAFV